MEYKIKICQKYYNSYNEWKKARRKSTLKER
jgi:hypothetical protein